VDGVAPPVIGGGPPEPFDAEPDYYEPPARHRADANASTPRGPGYGTPPRHTDPYGQPAQPRPDYHQPAGLSPHYAPAGENRAEPPTSPIPAIQPPAQQPEKRKSWVSRVFRLPGD